MTEDAQPETETPVEEPRQPAEAERTRVSPGHLLRSARERQELSLDELSAQTLLNRSTVEALENNEFDRLSQPVFVRGYYRKCAKVLGVPEDEIMEAYAKWTGEAGPRPASPGQVDVIPQDVTPQRWRVLGLILMVLAVLAVGAVAWSWLPSLVNGTSEGGANGDTTTLETETSDTAAVADSGQVASDDDDAGSEGAPEPASGSEDTAATGGDSDVSVDPEPVAGVDGTDADAETGDADSSAADNASDGSDAAAAPADTKLVLRFEERSWARVRDAEDNTLLDGIVGSGNLRVIDGTLPYEVALGYAPGVAVALGERDIDVNGHTGDDDTARFTVRADGNVE